MTLKRSTLALLDQYLEPEELSEFDRLLAQESAPPIADLSFRAFVSSVQPRYEWYRHCVILADRLQDVADGTLKRLMVFMPPRHGKSELVSRYFPAYYLLKHPDQWVGVCSYEATLAQGFSRVARDAFQRLGGELRGDSSAVALWETTQGGGMWAGGVGGPITGKGAHCGIVDDPIKNDEEARSETIREKQKTWYNSTFYSRLEPDGAVVIVQTRWHEDDLCGHLLAQEKEAPQGWHVVSFEAVKEEKQAVVPPTCTLEKDWRHKDEALCPERFDERTLAVIKRQQGSYFWHALYQQTPTPDEGGRFKRGWWKYYKEAPKTFDFLAISWDCAFKDTIGSDFVVGELWGVKRPNVYLVDLVRDHMDFPTTLAAVKALRAKWQKTNVMWIEDKANGPAVISTLQRTVPGIVAVNPEGGKESRAAAVSPLVEAGNVYLPEDAEWVGDFVSECASFPNGRYDDQVDAMTQALLRLAPLMPALTEKKRERPQDQDTSEPRAELAKKAGTWKGQEPGRRVRMPRVYEELR